MVWQYVPWSILTCLVVVLVVMYSLCTTIVPFENTVCSTDDCFWPWKAVEVTFVIMALQGIAFAWGYLWPQWHTLAIILTLQSLCLTMVALWSSSDERQTHTTFGTIVVVINFLLMLLPLVYRQWRASVITFSAFGALLLASCLVPYLRGSTIRPIAVAEWSSIAGLVALVLWTQNTSSTHTHNQPSGPSSGTQTKPIRSSSAVS